MALFLFCKIKIWALVIENNVLNCKFYDLLNQYLIIGLNKPGQGQIQDFEMEGEFL